MGSNQGDGTLNSSSARRYLVLVAMLISTQSCAQTEHTSIAKCFEKKADMKVARIDKKNHRIFAIPEQRSEEAILSQVRSSAECFSNSNWSNDWSISLFTNEKYAGYKDEQHIVPYHRNNEWAKAYLGEYDGHSQTYASFPAMKP
jgi:hypothetical protein